MTRLVWLFLIVICTNAQRETSKEKYNYLLAETVSSKYGVIELSDVAAKKYIMDHPRNYDLVVLFTTKACSMCRLIEKAFYKVGEAYKKNSMYLPRKHKNAEKIQKPIFFMQVNISFENMLVVDYYKMTTLPCISLSLADEINITDPYERRQYLNTYFWRITSGDGVINENIILRWLTRLTGNTHIEIKRPIWVFFLTMALVVLALSVLVLVYIFAQPIILNEKVWLLGSIIVFVLCCGGTYFTLNHRLPLIGFEHNEIEFVMKGSRSQYGIEGPLIMSVFVLVTICLLSIRWILKSNMGYFSKVVVCYALFHLALKMVFWVEAMFSSKNFYNPLFVPPKYYIRGSLNRDHGIIQ